LIGYEKGKLVYDPFNWKMDNYHQNILFGEPSFEGYRFTRGETLNAAMRVLAALLPRKKGFIHAIVDSELENFFGKGDGITFELEEAITAKELGCKAFYYHDYFYSAHMFFRCLGSFFEDKPIDPRRYFVVDGRSVFYFDQDQISVHNLLMNLSPDADSEGIRKQEKLANLLYLLPFGEEGNESYRAVSLNESIFSYGKPEVEKTPLFENYGDKPAPFEGMPLRDSQEYQRFLDKHFEVMGIEMRSLLKKWVKEGPAYVFFSLRSTPFLRYLSKEKIPADVHYIQAGQLNEMDKPSLERGVLWAEHVANVTGTTNKDIDIREKSHEIRVWLDAMSDIWPKLA
jgi:hypothetical protein